MSKTLESETGDIRKWELPPVEDVHDARYSRLITAEQIEKIQNDAYQEAYEKAYKEGLEKGYKEGVSSGEAYIRENTDSLKTIITKLAYPLEDLDEKVVEQLVELSVIIAGQVIRRELRIDPGQIIAVVRECVTALPIAARNINFYLHPDDARLVRETFSIDDMSEQVWSIKEDPVLTRGGCRVETQNSKIDATVEQQIKRIVANLFGGEREEDDGE